MTVELRGSGTLSNYSGAVGCLYRPVFYRPRYLNCRINLRTRTLGKSVLLGNFFLSIIAIADLMLSYISLGDTEFRMRQNFRTRVIPRENIECVSVAKGCPITLHLSDGGRVELPDLAVQGLGNSLRAWIRAT